MEFDFDRSSDDLLSDFETKDHQALRDILEVFLSKVSSLNNSFNRYILKRNATALKNVLVKKYSYPTNLDDCDNNSFSQHLRVRVLDKIVALTTCSHDVTVKTVNDHVNPCRDFYFFVDDIIIEEFSYIQISMLIISYQIGNTDRDSRQMIMSSILKVFKMDDFNKIIKTYVENILENVKDSPNFVVLKMELFSNDDSCLLASQDFLIAVVHHINQPWVLKNRKGLINLIRFMHKFSKDNWNEDYAEDTSNLFYLLKIE